MTNADLPEYITAKDIQQMLKCSQPTAYEIIHSKAVLPMRVKLGKFYRIDKVKFLKLIDGGFEF